MGLLHDCGLPLCPVIKVMRKLTDRELDLLVNALNSVDQHMVGWLATQYQRLAAKAERDGQYAAACGALNSLRVMLVQPQLDRQFEAHFLAALRTRSTGAEPHHQHRR